MHFQQSQKTSQRGVTLLLSLLVLSTIMAIVFSLATILLIEVRSSGDLVRTEGAYYGTDGLSEQVLFNYKRNLPAGAMTYASAIGNASLPAPVVNTISDPLQQVTVPVNTFTNSTNIYPLYDASSGPSLPASNYGGVKISYVETGNTNPLTVYVCQFNINELIDTSDTITHTYDGAPCSDANDNPQVSDSYWIKNGTANYFTVLHNNFLQLSASSGWDSSKQQEIILVNSGSGGGNMYVQIQAYDTANNPIGIPYFNKISVNVSGAERYR